MYHRINFHIELIDYIIILLPAVSYKPQLSVVQNEMHQSCQSAKSPYLLLISFLVVDTYPIFFLNLSASARRPIEALSFWPASLSQYWSRVSFVCLATAATTFLISASSICPVNFPTAREWLLWPQVALLSYTLPYHSNVFSNLWINYLFTLTFLPEPFLCSFKIFSVIPQCMRLKLKMTLIWSNFVSFPDCIMNPSFVLKFVVANQ